MGSYAQWRTAADRGDVRKVTWVCGDQRVLVEEVIDTTRRQLNVNPMDYVSISAASTPDRETWAAANQYPLTPDAPRLVLVRDAERIRNWEPLTTWLAGARRLPTVHLVLVSNEVDVSAKDHVETIKARGRIVRCSMPNEQDAIAWAQRRANLDTETARHLLIRVGGDLGEVASVCAKLAIFNGQPGSRVIDALCEPAPGASFADALIAMRKPQALLATRDLTDRDIGWVVGHLDTRLDMLANLCRALRCGQSLREVREVPVFLAKQLMPYAKHYDARRCAHIRRALAVVDDAYRSGARVGVLEALVAMW